MEKIVHYYYYFVYVKLHGQIPIKIIFFNHFVK